MIEQTDYGYWRVRGDSTAFSRREDAVQHLRSFDVMIGRYAVVCEGDVRAGDDE